MIDAGRHMMAICTRAKEEGRFPRRQIPAGKRGHVAFDREFARMIGQPRNGAGQPCFDWHIDEQIVGRGRADGREHILPVGVGKG